MSKNVQLFFPYDNYKVEKENLPYIIKMLFKTSNNFIN